MRVLLAEQILDSELNVDINMPYIKGVLNSVNLHSFYLRYINPVELTKAVNMFKPDFIVTNQYNHCSISKSKVLNSVNFMDFLLSHFKIKTATNIFQYLPVFDCDNSAHLEESRYIPHLVFSNLCNYSKNICVNPFYKNITLPKNIKLNGCSFCTDLHSNVKWEVRDRKNIIHSLLVAINFANRSNHKSIRILGEAFTARPDKIFLLLQKLKISGKNIIITLRPEILSQNIDYFIKALKIASECKNRLILCSVGIESFYDYDLMLFNRYMKGKDILKVVSLLYLLKNNFRETLVLDRYELFNFILFHPYTTKESLEYNIRIMKAIGIERINKACFLNTLRINENTAIKYLIKKDGLLKNEIEWKFKYKPVERFFNHIKNSKDDFIHINELLNCLFKYG